MGNVKAAFNEKVIPCAFWTLQTTMLSSRCARALRLGVVGIHIEFEDIGDIPNPIPECENGNCFELVEVIEGADYYKFCEDCENSGTARSCDCIDEQDIHIPARTPEAESTKDICEFFGGNFCTIC